MISISSRIQILFSKFVADEVVHALSSVVKTFINSKFMLGIVCLVQFFCFIVDSYQNT